MSDDKQIIIVGAGPVGLLLALGLARQGIPTTILEKDATLNSSPRAAVFHWSVLAGLSGLGILDDMMEEGFIKNEFCFRVHRTGERIEWTNEILRDHVQFADNVHLTQDRLGKIALQHLAKYPNANVVFNSEVTAMDQHSDHVVATVAGPEGAVRKVSGSLLVACDGGRSTVRRLNNLAFDGHTWDHRFVATNILANLEEYGYWLSTMNVDKIYGAVIAKIDKVGMWRCTYCEPSELPSGGVHDRMHNVFANIFHDVPSEAIELLEYSPYRMHQRSLTTYYNNRVIFAGDAAHVTNPTGALGLTAGLFDLYVLSEAIGAVMTGEASPKVLEEYSKKRRKNFLEVASPQASQNNRFLYHSSDSDQLESGLANLRRVASDPDFRLERALFTLKMETPSLLTGRTLNVVAS